MKKHNLIHKITILVFISLFMGSCCIPIIQKRYYKTKKYKMERPYKFKKKYVKPINENKKELYKYLNNNAIYRNISSIVLNGEKMEFDQFIRFFDTGQFLWGSMKWKSMEKEVPYNTLDMGYVGYYYIDDNNDIHMYEFSVGAQDCGNYSEYIYTIGDNSIQRASINEIWNRIEVSDLEGTPYW
ncbi:hypothetical protein KRX57_04695 [Weeksellaceae bacterium TAE3-ERU29]|nr:hypothetical protein [Weeksellaceae bacterium TAE3-ERU29]